VDAQKQFQLPLELQVEHKDDKLVVNLQYHDLKQHVPEHLTTRVSNDNQQFLLERNLFNPELQKFLLDTLTLIGNNESTNETMVEVLLKFSFDLIARANDNKLLETFVTRLRELLTPKSSLVFLENMFFSKVQRTIDLLLVCPESKTRQLFAKLLAQAFNLVINEYVTIEDLTE
jgi:ubiquitin carboxyl-terminal hydrolase 34